MSNTIKYSLEIILEHIKVCEKRTLEIDEANDFIATEHGEIILDSIVARLQALGENLKRILKKYDSIVKRNPHIEFDKIILFRDFVSHHYEMLDYEIIFDICKIDLPVLKLAIENELKLF